MPDLNLDLNYFSHKKTRRLVDLLRKGAEVLPIKLWVYCGRTHARDGRLTRYTEQDIEKIVEWWGPRGACVAALIEAGFLKQTKTGFTVVNWTKHQRHFALYEDRARNAANARWARSRGGAASIASCIAPAVQRSAVQGGANGTPTTKAERTKAAYHARL